MKPLYEITSEYQNIMQQVMDCDEIDANMLGEIERIEGDIKDKAVNVAAFIKNLEAEEDSIEKAIQAMQERAKKVFNKVVELREYLKDNLENCSLKEVKSPFFDIRIKNNPVSVSVIDETIIPDQYFKETFIRKIDKATISMNLRNNIMIPGVALQQLTRLEIK